LLVGQYIDHIVIVTKKLADASADYASAGFTVTPGGDHTFGGRSTSHNALITFQDGAYFELIAFKDPEAFSENRWKALLDKGEGLVDFAVFAEDLPAQAEALAARGIVLNGGVRDGGRKRPDGQQVDWKMAALQSTPETKLPFIIEDVTPRNLRVPDGDAAVHPLGITGVAGLTVLVKDLGVSSAAYEKVVGSEGTAVTPAFDGVNAAKRFTLSSGQWVDLVEPAGSSSEIGAYLAERGEGPFEVVLKGAAEAGRFPLETTHGARIRIEA
jgi:hypothetical protein